MERSTIRSFNIKERKNPLKLRVLYYGLVLFLFYCVARNLVSLMDFYVSQPNENYYIFYSLNFSDYAQISILVLFGCMLAVFFLIHSALLTVVCADFFSLILACASSIKYANRHELIHFSDLFIKGANVIWKEYALIHWNKYLMLFLVLIVVSILMALGLELGLGSAKIRMNSWKNAVVSVFLAGLTLLLMVTITVGFGKTKQSLDTYLSNAEKGVSKRFVLYHFINKERVSFTDEQVEEILSKIDDSVSQNQENQKSLTPNVIAIMNESWWNTDNIDTSRVFMSKDPMEPFNSLPGEAITGYVSVNVYGGGTVSSEGEFLTGMNTKYFTSDSGFFNTIGERQEPSIVSYFNQLGYQTTAIHPYYGEFYNRREIYPMLGFDRILFDEDMHYSEIYSRYISDDSLVNEIIYQYEEQKSEGPIFLWSVSIGNHRRTLDYKEDPILDYEYPIDVEVSGSLESGEEQQNLVNYINGVYYSNLAIKKLIDYFSVCDEPTVVLMFGDHIPNYSESTAQLLGLNTSSDIVEEKQKIYTTPVVLWKNYETEKTDLVLSGQTVNYLDSILIEYAGLPTCAMAELLRTESDALKADTRFWRLGNNNQLILELNEVQISAILDLATIQYDLLIGNQLSMNVWNPYE